MQVWEICLIIFWIFKNLFLQPPVLTSFQDYVTGLQTLISNVVDHIKGLETHLIALKLEELILEDTSLSLVRDCRLSVISYIKIFRCSYLYHKDKLIFHSSFSPYRTCD